MWISAKTVFYGHPLKSFRLIKLMDKITSINIQEQYLREVGTPGSWFLCSFSWPSRGRLDTETFHFPHAIMLAIISLWWPFPVVPNIITNREDTVYYFLFTEKQFTRVYGNVPDYANKTATFFLSCNVVRTSKLSICIQEDRQSS